MVFWPGWQPSCPGEGLALQGAIDG